MVRQYAEHDAAATRRTVRFCAPQAGHVALDPGAKVDYTNLLAACGLLPRSLGRVAVEIDVHRPIQQMGTGELTIRSVLQASGANPATLCASSTRQPASSSRVVHETDTVIDSIAARTGAPRRASRSLRPIGRLDDTRSHRF